MNIISKLQIADVRRAEFPCKILNTCTGEWGFEGRTGQKEEGVRAAPYRRHPWWNPSAKGAPDW